MIEIIQKEIDTVIGDINSPVCENPPLGRRFKPEPPFDRFPKGYVSYNKTQHRRWANLFGLPGTRTERDVKTLPFARYLKLVNHHKKTGEILSDNIDVHHVDEDKLNDIINNLDIVNRNDHNSFSQERTVGKYVKLVCPVCKSLGLSNPTFDKLTHEIQLLKEYESRKSQICCSSEHGNFYNSTRQSLETTTWIRNNQIVEIYYRRNNGERLQIIETFNSPLLDPNWTLCDEHNIPIDFALPRYLTTDEKIKFIIAARIKDPYCTNESLGTMLGIHRTSVNELIERYCPEYHNFNKHSRRRNIKYE